MVQPRAAEKRPPGKEREAAAKSSSRLSRQPRQDQARRRSWRQQTQDVGTQTGKPIRLNRVPLLRAESSSPLLRAETSSPGTTSKKVPRLSQAVVLVSSSSSSSSRHSFPRQKRALKRGRPQEATEPQAPESPLAKRRKMDDVPAQSAESSSSGQVAQRQYQDAQSSRNQVVLYIPPWVLPRSQPGPIRTRHVWRQQQREMKPYSRPENQSRNRRAPARGAYPPRPSK